MKKVRLYGLGLLTLVFVTSCSKQPPLNDGDNSPQKPYEVVLTEDEKERLILLEGDYTVSEKELLSKAEAFSKSLAQTDVQTKGKAVHRTPVLSDSVIFIATLPALTKSGGEENQEVKIYVVSFGDGAGYAYFGGDKRASVMLGYRDEGNFEPETDNPGLLFLNQTMEEYMLSEIERMESLRGDSLYQEVAKRYTRVAGTLTKFLDPLDPLGPDDWGPWGPPPGHPNGPQADRVEYDYYNEVEENLEFKAPLLTTKWNQYGPYDIIVQQVYGNFPVGCVATAVAQIMNYHKKPVQYSNYYYSWTSYKNTYGEWYQSGVTDVTRQNIGYLFYHLGLSQNLSTTYAPGGSPAPSGNVPRTFRNFGYSCSNVEGYNLNSITTSLFRNRPVYISAAEKTLTTAHAWVLDGVRGNDHYEVKITRFYLGSTLVWEGRERYLKNRRFSYLHANWGWGGSYDTWCYDGLFRLNGTYYEKQYQLVLDARPN